MSDGMNRVMLLGNLGSDPELRRGAEGTCILKLRLATNESWLDKNKEREDHVEWHDVTVFGARAEALSKILAKGSCILVEGGLRTSSYEKDGVRKYRTEVIARDICLTPRRGGSDAPAFAGMGRNGAAPPPPAVLEELPF